MNQKLAIKLLLWLNAAVILFHLAILTKIIPYDVIWGGRLNNDVEMYVFEGISILVNLLLCLVLYKRRIFVEINSYKCCAYHFMDFLFSFWIKYDWKYFCRNTF